MAVKYLRSAAAGAGTGADWTNAYTTLVAAFAGAFAGDTIYVADDHAETQVAAMALVSPGTVGVPVLVLCVNTHVTTPPTALATSATIATTFTNAISMTGVAYFYGIGFSCGSAANNTSLQICSTSTGAAFDFVFEACKFTLATTNASAIIRVGQCTASTKEQSAKWINCTVKFGSVSQTITTAGGRFSWLNTSSAIDAGGSTPTNLFATLTASESVAIVSGVDLSLLGAAKNLVSAGISGGSSVFYISNCKLGGSVSAISGTITAQGGCQVFLENADSSGTNYRMEYYKYQGSIVHETTKVRTSGASDGTTPISHKFVTLATGSTFTVPLEGPWMTAWGDTTGSAKTATVEILHDSLTALTDAEVWLEVEYLGTSSFPQSIYLTDRAADVFASGVAQTSSSATWTTTGIVNINKQKLEVTFTPQSKGPIRARVCVAKASYTLYVDPLLTVA